MNKQIPTGQVADLLFTTEPRLNDLIRRGRIHPAPLVISGRRAWNRGHVLQAAIRLGVDLDVVHRRLQAALRDDADDRGPAATQQPPPASTSTDEGTGGAR